MSPFSFKNVVFYIQVLVNLICVRNFGKVIIKSSYYTDVWKRSNFITVNKKRVTKKQFKTNAQFLSYPSLAKYVEK